MAKRNGPVKIKQYSVEFKLEAVQLGDQPHANYWDPLRKHLEQGS